MSVSIDTNVILRFLLGDDAEQFAIAQQTILEHDIITVTHTCLCEVVWVLGRGYGFSSIEIADILEDFLVADNLRFDEPAIELALQMLRDGGDFADGIIAHQGYYLGAETFLSFDRKAVRLLQKHHQNASLLQALSN